MAVPPEPDNLRFKLHEIIFEADTPLGKAFDVALLVAILISVAAVCLESVEAIEIRYGTALRALEWVLTIAFTLEYVLRLVCIRKPWRYARSFFGIVDLLSILPTYLSLMIGGAQSLLIIRALRLLRVFRILKMAQFLTEAGMLRQALFASFRKITIFVVSVLTCMLILGTLMYLVEGEENGFTSIPQSLYWAIVTMTTVGYGDIAPQTVPGKFIASIAMIMGYGIIAVPTGIVTMELGFASRKPTTQACLECSAEVHAFDAVFCRKCGAKLGPRP